MKISLHKTIFAILAALAAMAVCAATPHKKEMHYRLMASDESLNPSLRLIYLDSLLSLQQDPSDSLLFQSAEIAYSSGNFKRAIDNMTTLLGKPSLPVNRRCEALFMLAKSQFKCDDEANGIESCNAILDLKKPDSLLYHDINCLTMMNDAISGVAAKADSISHREKLSLYLSRAEEILRHSEKEKLDSEVLNKMRKAVLFSKMTLAADTRDYDNALKYGAEMLRLPVSKLERLALEGNMAMIYYMIGNTDMASQYYEKALSEPAWHTNHAVCLGNYMIILNNTGKSQKALELMDAHPDILSMVKGQTYYVNIMVSRGYALFNIDRFEEACQALFEAQQLSDSINREAKYETLIKLIDASENKRELKSAKKDIGLKDNIIAVMAILCLILIIALALLAMKHTRLRKSQSNAKSQENHLSENVKPNSPADTDSSENEAVKALHLASLNETISSIAATVDDSKITEQEKLAQINTLIKEVASYDDLWEIFHIQFEKLHPSFFRNLIETYPTLTQGEVRMCAYVMLNMSNKEIAALTRRNVRSVETMRYRLTKKMNLTEGETLSSRLAKI